MLTAYTYTDYTEQGMVLIARAIFLSERGQTQTQRKILTMPTAFAGQQE